MVTGTKSLRKVRRDAIDRVCDSPLLSSMQEQNLASQRLLTSYV